MFLVSNTNYTLHIAPGRKKLLIENDSSWSKQQYAAFSEPFIGYRKSSQQWANYFSSKPQKPSRNEYTSHNSEEAPAALKAILPPIEPKQQHNKNDVLKAILPPIEPKKQHNKNAENDHVLWSAGLVRNLDTDSDVKENYESFHQVDSDLKENYVHQGSCLFVFVFILNLGGRWRHLTAY